MVDEPPPSVCDVDKECTYNISAGESLGFDPITHDAYLSIIEARKSQSN